MTILIFEIKKKKLMHEGDSCKAGNRGLRQSWLPVHAFSLTDSTAPFKIDEEKRPAASLRKEGQPLNEEFCGVKLKQPLPSPPSVGDWKSSMSFLLLRGSLGRLQIRGTYPGTRTPRS